jgi:TonB family protein
MISSPPALNTEPELSLLLLDEHDRPSRSRLLGVGAGSILLNILLLSGFVTLAGMEGSPGGRPPQPSEISKSTPLIFPRELTQKEPNRAEVTKQIHLADLVSKPELRPEKRVFSPPPVQRSAPSQASQPATPALEPPKIVAQAPPTLGTTPDVLPPPTAPPQIQATEKPKLAFESPGLSSASPSSRPGGLGKIAPPRATVEDAVRAASRPGSGGVVIGDMPDDSGIGQRLGQTPSPGRQASQVELLSDPQGVDFKPYLIRVLAAVRRNWFSVIPESGRLGRQGKVVIQFSINKAGAVPKLVITLPSGTEALDRAAVAGISASNPFPPLPTEFRGDQIRVQLVFSYNVQGR